MNKTLKSKTAAWAVFVLVVILVVATYSLRSAWWTFTDIFFIFMAAFSHLIAVNINKFNPYASRRLDLVALVFFILFIVALIGEYVVLHALT